MFLSPTVPTVGTTLKEADWRVRCFWDHLDGMCNWIHLKLLYKHLEFWQEVGRITSLAAAWNKPRKFLFLLKLTPTTQPKQWATFSSLSLTSVYAVSSAFHLGSCRGWVPTVLSLLNCLACFTNWQLTFNVPIMTLLYLKNSATLSFLKIIVQLQLSLFPPTTLPCPTHPPTPKPCLNFPKLIEFSKLSTNNWIVWIKIHTGASYYIFYAFEVSFIKK